MKVTLRIQDGDEVRELTEDAGSYDAATASILEQVPDGAVKLAWMVDR